VLATGIYTIFVGWGWRGWMVVALVSVVVLALIGGLLSGIPMARLTPGIEKADGALPADLRIGLRSRALSISVAARMAITLGIAFLMVRKPDPLDAALVILLAAGLGVTIGAAFGPRATRPAPASAEGGVGRT